MITIASKAGRELLADDEVHALKVRIQEFFQPNTVIVIGLGPSASFGLPTMEVIADQLKYHLSSCLVDNDLATWRSIEKKLDAGTGLEQALQSESISDSLYAGIVKITSRAVIEKERVAIAQMIGGTKLPPISRLMSHLAAGNPTINVVTTNYDRLIEVQSELAGLGVDVGYPGAYASPYNPKSSARTHKSTVPDRRTRRKIIDRHVRVFKPHGSLDWIRAHGLVRRSMVHPVENPVIIAPGPSKYRTGYEEPFTRQREGACGVLRAAQRIIALGYGFNDDQLEQSWCAGLVCEKPLLIVTKDLTPNGQSLVGNSKSVIALSRADPENSGFTYVTETGASETYIKRDLWSLEGFVNEMISHE